MDNFAVVSVATCSHLPRARALARSIRNANPDCRIYVCVVDRPSIPLDRSREPFQFFHGDELGIPSWKRFSFQYTPFELCGAIRPYAIEHVLKNVGYSKVLYLDSDIQVYRSLNCAVEAMNCCSILLTPHLIIPRIESVVSTSATYENEIGICRAGIFNSGVVGVKQTKTGETFLKWWKARLNFCCVVDVSSGLFVDQSWLDLVPGLFNELRVERDPGWNVAYWNLNERSLEWAGDGRILVNGDPLVCFHFSGFDPGQPAQVSKYGCIKLSQYPVVEALTSAYSCELDRCDQENERLQECGFSHMKDGTPIDPLWREAIRKGYPSLLSVEDPFDNIRYPDLMKLFKETEPEARMSRCDWREQFLLKRAADASRMVSHVESSRVLGPLVRRWATWRKWDWAKVIEDMKDHDF